MSSPLILCSMKGRNLRGGNRMTIGLRITGPGHKSVQFGRHLVYVWLPPMKTKLLKYLSAGTTRKDSVVVSLRRPFAIFPHQECASLTRSEHIVLPKWEWTAVVLLDRVPTSSSWGRGVWCWRASWSALNSRTPIFIWAYSDEHGTWTDSEYRVIESIVLQLSGDKEKKRDKKPGGRSF